MFTFDVGSHNSVSCVPFLGLHQREPKCKGGKVHEVLSVLPHRGHLCLVQTVLISTHQDFQVKSVPKYPLQYMYLQHLHLILDIMLSDWELNFWYVNINVYS